MPFLSVRLYFEYGQSPIGHYKFPIFFRSFNGFKFNSSLSFRLSKGSPIWCGISTQPLIY